MLKILFTIGFLISFSAFGQYSDTLSCSGGALEYVVHYNQQQCDATCDGRYEIEILAGVGPYNYTVTGPSYSHTNFEDSLLCLGAYDIQVEDVGQAITCNIGINIDALTAMTYSPGVTGTSGGGACDGEAWMSVSGGVPGYTYVWYDAGQVVIPGQTDSIMTNLCAGIYYVKVYDSAIGCQDSTGFVQLTVANPPINVVITNTYEEVCPGSCDAGFDYIVTGGSGNYTYQWNGAGAMGGGQEFPTCPIDGTFEVWDDAGGYASAFVFFNQWPGITIFPAATDESCSGSCDGSIFFDDQWSPGADQYSIDGGLTYQSSPNFDNLCPNAYHLFTMVVDAYGGWGCPIDLGVHTVNPGGANPLSVLETVEDNTCLSDCNGTGELLVSGNTGIYTVEWYDDLGALIGIGDSIDSLCGGVYDYTVTDPSGCSFSDSILILDPPIVPPITYTIVTTPTSGGGACDATATLTLSGGLPPYTVQWYDQLQVPIPWETGLTVDSLCVGTYYLSFDDSQSGGCGTGSGSGGLIPVVITEAMNLVLVFEQSETCPWNCDAMASFQASGGSGNYMYDLDGMVSPTGEFFGLCPGQYTVTVTDDLGNSTSIPYEIFPIMPPSVFTTFTSETCLGACDGSIDFIDPFGEAIQFSIDGGVTWSGSPNFTGLCPGGYDCYVLTWNGCPIPVDYVTIVAGPVFNPSLTFSSSDEQCYESCDGTVIITDPSGESTQFSIGGLFSPSNVLNDVCAGDYDVTVQNAQGCEATYPLAITVGQPDSISISVQVSTSGCNYPCNGSIIATAIGGTGVLEYSIDSTNWFTTGDFDGLCPGIDTVIVRDENGCVNVLIFEIQSYQSLTVGTNVNINYSDVTNCTGDILAIPSGGVAPYEYKWKSCEVGALINQSANPTDLCPGAYYVEVTDANGCTATSSPCDTIHSIAGVNVLTANNWSVYPNPTSSILNVDGAGQNDFSVSLLDVRGRTIYFSEVKGDFLQIDLKNKNILPGTYLIEIKRQGSIIHKRLIIQ